MGGTFRMSFSVTDIRKAVLNVYSMLNDDDILGYLNQVRPRILRQFRLRNTTQTFNITNGTQEYAITTPMLGATAVEYVRSATTGDFKVLESTSIERLDSENSAWRRRNVSEPTFYYFTDGLTGPKMGLTPTPDTTTASGYPNIRVRYIDCETVTTMASVLYDDLLSGAELYSKAICERYSEDQGFTDYPLRRQLCMDCIAANEAYLKGRQRNDTTTQIFNSNRKVSGVT
jgi:hypothetical protein